VLVFGSVSMSACARCNFCDCIHFIYIHMCIHLCTDSFQSYTDTHIFILNAARQFCSDQNGLKFTPVQLKKVLNSLAIDHLDHVLFFYD
jgi:hypothetical protein